MKDFRYGYNDKRFVKIDKWDSKKTVSIVLAVMFILGVWLFLDQKLLFGEDWLSPTYDNEHWRTNEGNLPTLGMWDFETHIWKTEYAIENFPNAHWNPYWYLGMPLYKYYQNSFYLLNYIFVLITQASVARAALLMIIFAHLAAALLTFVLCYKFSRRPWPSAFASILLLATPFVTMRSYGWEPVTVAFLFLFPLTLLVFFRQPMRPLRFWIVILLAITYLSHPLIFFALCMTMGLYLFSIAIRPKDINVDEKYPNFLWQYFAAVFLAVLIGAVQFLPQITYTQVTSGAHMGVSYIPFYHVPFNIISLKDFIFNAGDLKGPGLSVMIALSLFLIFFFIERQNKGKLEKREKILGNPLVSGILLVLLTMIAFYYLEAYNIFPMNLLRSIQYHRIIPEFVIISAVFICSLSNLIYSKNQEKIYLGILIAFALASLIVVYNVQADWQTTESISDRPEFIYDENIDGRITFPYTSQSLAVRSSFTEIPQTYGYYEQGVTNSYADEIFSVSSGFHTADLTILYLKAANIGRIYINTEEGRRDRIMLLKFEGILNYTHEGGRYAYFEVPLEDPSFAQAVDLNEARRVQEFAPGCRTMFREKYCGSAKEEFVDTDLEEIRYLREYVGLTERSYEAQAEMEMVNPDLYRISVSNADENTAVIVKMTYDDDFAAFVDSEEVGIEKIGPDFMLIKPARSGDYEIELRYNVSKPVFIGGIISVVALVFTIAFFLVRPDFSRFTKFKEGDMR